MCLLVSSVKLHHQNRDMTLISFLGTIWIFIHRELLVGVLVYNSEKTKESHTL